MSDEKQPLDALDRISLEASGDEKDADAAEQAILNPESENQIDPAAAWAQIPKMLGGLLSIPLPELAAAYTDGACQQWGGAMAMVADKYGWDAGETMSKWAPEIALCFASLPLVLPTIAAVKRKRAEAAQNKPRDENIQTVDVKEEASEAQGGNFVNQT